MAKKFPVRLPRGKSKPADKWIQAARNKKNLGIFTHSSNEMRNRSKEFKLSPGLEGVA